MKQLLTTWFFCLCAAAATARTGDSSAIRRILDNQVAAWNKGLIDEYMAAGYWQHDSLLFIGKNGPTYGYDATLERYRKSYPDKAHMGQLRFELISLRRLSGTYYFAVGKWFLTRDAGNVNGSWTLLFRRIGGRWRIVADHSS